MSISPLTQVWIAYKLVYNEPWDTFLAKMVQPFVHTIIYTGIASRYFFTRSWEKSPHIRLYIKGEKEDLENILKPNLEQHFKNYFEAMPSLRKEPQYHPDIPINEKLLNNNSLYSFEYEPDTTTFGGNIGLDLVESHYQVSSDFVLNTLKKNIGKAVLTYDDLRGIAIKLNLSFAYAVGLTIEEATAFFKEMTLISLPTAFSYNRERMTQQQFDTQQQGLLSNFDKAFLDQKEELVNYHASLWDSLKSNQLFEDEDVNKWIIFNKKLDDDIKKAIARKHIIIELEEDIENDEELKNIAIKQWLWNTYIFLLIETANRLGISKADETYLNHLTMKSLECFAEAH